MMHEPVPGRHLSLLRNPRRLLAGLCGMWWPARPPEPAGHVGRSRAVVRPRRDPAVLPRVLAPAVGSDDPRRAGHVGFHPPWSQHGFWTRADRVPGVAVLLGRCHRCHGLVAPSGEACPACGVALGFQPGTVEPGPGAPDPLRSGTPFDLVSRAQYRRIERLQATVRTQVVLLALLVSLLFAVLVVWLAQPRP